MWGFLEDLRYGLRALAKNRGFSSIAIMSLALGIGANTTIFTLVNAILLQPLPVFEPTRLVAVHTLDPRFPGLLYCSYPNYRDYRDHNTVFSSLLLYTGAAMSLTGGGDPHLVLGNLVSGNYFEALGVRPVIGRSFLPEEDGAPGAFPVVVVSYRFWMSDLGGDPRVTDRSLQINGRAYRVVGVAPPSFQGLNRLTAVDIWAPVAMYAQLYSNAARVEQRRALLFAVAGRLKPGVSLQRAESSLQSMAQELERQYPKDNQGRRIKLTSVAEAALSPRTTPVITRASAVLLIISGLVLLIACGNVANLLLVRAAGRSREITVRLALGASRWRLVRQLLTESLLLALIGAAVGLVLARWARDFLWHLRPPMLAYAAVHLDLNGRVLTYTLVSAVLTGVVFGLVPALRATSSDLATDLKERAGTSVSRGRWHPRGVLVTGQVAFSVVALVGAGLFVRSLMNAGLIDPGFDAAHVGVVSFNLLDQGYNQARGRDFQRRVLERAVLVPGVVSAALSRDLPFRVSAAPTVLPEGQENTPGRITLACYVTPGFLQTVGIPLRRGRNFGPLDGESAPRVAVINEAAAAQFWPGQEAVGKRMQFVGDPLPVQVVGVARNANYREIGEPPQPLLYLSLLQYYMPTAVLYVRTTGDPDALLGAVRGEVRGLDRNLLLETEAVHTTIRESLWAQRLSAGLLAVFGILALLLSAVGIYGVISYTVNQRAREIGVRVALGATSANVELMVLREGVRLVAIGVTAGTLIALGASRSVEGLLFVISPRDAMTFVLVPSILTLVAVLACWFPAHRASRIDPAIALREE
jgi:predicted permease